MANRQTYVIGALGVLVGMALGMNSSAQSADVVSYSGSDPNAESIQSMPHLRRAAGILRFRSYQPGVRLTESQRSSIEDNVANRLEVRLQDLLRGAAPSYTVRGAPAPAQLRARPCVGYTRERYIRCLEAYINGEPFEGNYFSR